MKTHFDAAKTIAMINQFTPVHRANIEGCAQLIRDIVAKHGQAGFTAVVLVFCELELEESMR